MDFSQIAILALVQGAAELLPVSSSAHVIAAEKLMGLDPASPEMTMLLVMLHTGTMFAVILYFWRSWKAAYFGAARARWRNLVAVGVATLATAVVGLGLQYAIKHAVMKGDPGFEIEQLFGNARLIAAALAAAGGLIIVSSFIPERGGRGLTLRDAGIIGAVQGLCLPFRGFSRSGATISAGLALGVARRRAEEFSFALAVVLTPAVVLKEGHRLLAARAGDVGYAGLGAVFVPGLLGMALSFLAGLVALRWLSRWLESGRWSLFGAYCLAAALFMLWLG